MASSDNIKRRGFLKAAGGATVAATLAGCTGDGSGDSTTSGDGSGNSTDDSGTSSGNDSSGSGGLLTYARGTDSSTLDFQATTSGEDAKVTNQIYDSLIEFKPGGTSLVAGLATDWNVDGKTVSLTLREGVKFHNGDEFTAEDYVATYRRFVDEEYEYFPGGDYVSSYGPYSLGNWIDSVSKEGKHKVSITLKQQYAPILANLAMFCSKVHSLKAIKEHGKELKSNPVGTGPFKFDSWDTGNQRIRLKKNGDYWGEDKANVDEVVFTAVGQNTSRAQTLLSQDAHIIDGLGAQSSQMIKQSNKAELKSIPGINVGYMAFNMARVEAFQNTKVRQAINYGINTKSIVETVFKGIASQASQPIPKSVMGYNEDLDPYPHDPEKAKKMLKDAGFENLSFELSIFKNPRPYIPNPRQAAQTIKSNLSNIGVEVSLNTMPWKQYLTYTENYKHDACFLGWMTDNGDPDNFYYALLHPGSSVKPGDVPDGQNWVNPDDYDGFNTLNAAAWANSEFMKLTEEAQKSYETGKRKPKYKKAGQIFYDDAPWVTLDHTKSMRGVANSVSGFKLAPIGGPFLNIVSIE